MKRNRIWLGLLTVTMLFGSVSPAVVKGAEILEKSQMVETEEQTEFEIENGVLTKYNGPGGDVTIPDGVVGIGAYAFSEYYRDGRITKVSIPEGVKSIGKYAFGDCKKLKSITLPKTIKSIGANAFNGCSSLTGITIPEGVKKIEESTFDGCSKLKSVKLPNTIKEMEITAFGGCSSLTSIDLPKNIEVISAWAFADCTSLKSIDIPKKVTTIQQSAFSGCSNLSNVNLPKKLSNIEGYVFRGCSSLTSIKLPQNECYIGNGAFSGSGLTNITIPSTMTIESDTFTYCKDLKTVVLDRVFFVEDNAFVGCSGLRSIVMPNVIMIDKDAFKECNKKKITIYCKKGSEAEKFAKKYKYSYSYGTAPKEQKITASDVTKTYGTKKFSLNAKSESGGKLTYQVSNKKVATVSKDGTVTMKGYGQTQVTISAAAKGNYLSTKKTVLITVKPLKADISSVKSAKSKKVTVKWKKDERATGYIIQYSTDRQFKKNPETITIDANKTTSKTIGKLKGGKNYYVRVCTYKKSNGKQIKGSYSAVKSIKVKK